MKALSFAIILLLGCSLVINSAEKLSCPGYPVKHSGRMLMFLKDTFIDYMPFNFDLNLERFQADLKIYKGNSSVPVMISKVLVDYKAGKTYHVSKGHCFIYKLTEGLPSAANVKRMIAKGRSGMHGANVGIYLYKKGSTVGILTLEDDRKCIAQSFSGKNIYGGFFVSYLDIKPHVNPLKLQIPQLCKKQMDRRTFTEDEVLPETYQDPPLPPVF